MGGAADREKELLPRSVLGSSVVGNSSIRQRECIDPVDPDYDAADDGKRQ
jgi:hypothetical protein